MKSSNVSIKTRSTPASLSFKGQATKHTTVKWSIAFYHSKFQFVPLKFSDTTYLNLRTAYAKKCAIKLVLVNIISQARIRENSFQGVLLTVFNISSEIHISRIISNVAN